MSKSKFSITMIILTILVIAIIACSIIFIPKTNGYKTNEMSDQSSETNNLIINNWHAQQTYSISIPLIASPTISYDDDWMIITYNNLYFGNQPLISPQENEAAK